MSSIRVGLLAFIAAAAVSLTASPASAQGCILLRQTCPAFGTTGSADLQPGAWNITFTGRSSTADTHYNGTERQDQRKREQTYVVNRQNSMTATLSYQLTPRVSLNASVPWVEASWGIPSPRSGGPAARANENASGMGDITTLARVSIFNPLTTHRTWNLQVGGGVFDLLGYKMMGRVTAFGSGTWLANPRNTGTPSRGNLVTNTTPTNVNTVSDQFVFRAGTSVTIFQRLTSTGVRQLDVTMAWRMEGVPRYDLFGRSDGFRRPGVEMYWEPGITLNLGDHAVSFNLPIGYYFNRFRNPYTGTRGDSTFPEYVAIATYSMRLNRTTKRPIMTDDAAGANPSSTGHEQKREKQDRR
jgi:hypothetical protein